MATQNPINPIEAVRHAAAQLVGLDWLDQEAAQRIGPVAEAVANAFMVVFYQEETGRATSADFNDALNAVRRSLHLP